MIVPLLFGVIGAAILIALGVWQVQRLAWKEGLIAEIEARIENAPVALPTELDPERDRYLPVEVSGTIAGQSVRVLHALPGQGPGYRVISAFETEDDRRILLDRGYIRAEAPVPDGGPLRVTGNLDWPNEVGSNTPAPDLMRRIWFGRDVPALANYLETEPVLLVARDVSPAEDLQPLAVTTVGIPNDHLQYAGTWFSLAAVWLGMTGFLLWRIRLRTT